jgi:CubicO group peptidase (beta-lactamase class C family)
MKRVIISSLVGLLLSSCMAAHSADAPSRPDDDLSKPGYIVGMIEGDEYTTLESTGAADIEQSRPITDETVFHVASLSKQITAAALAHAILDGRVSLEDPASQYIPELRKYENQLTVAHLVYMTSGLTEYTSVPRQDGHPWATFHYFTVDDAIEASLSVGALKFEPGKSWDYSNINYMLITRIVEAAYDQDFADIVKTRIFAPLGMHASLINDDTTQIIPNRAHAYIARNEATLSALREGAQIDAREDSGLIMIHRNAPHYGGSGVMTSLSDWSLWMQEMISHKTFGDDFWALMKRTQTFDHEKSNDAFGLVHGQIDDHKTLWYEGGDIDASSYMVVIPSEQIGVVCFANDPSNSCRPHVMAHVERQLETR